MSTNPNLDQAREWAEYAARMGTLRNDARAAIDLIESLPDEWIDADQLRNVINAQLSSYPHGTAGHHMAEEIACKLEALFPAPKPRTLADMTPEEREACRLMQCTTDERDGLWVIHLVDGDLACLINEIGDWENAATSSVIPLPDLPRMVWPGEQTAEETPDTPRPEDAPDGYYLIRWWGEERPVPAEKVQGQWRATGWRAGILPAKEITIVSRLVPEVEA